MRALCNLVVIPLCMGLGAGLCAQPLQLTSGPGDHTEAAWSPDGSRIAFQLAAEGGHRLCLLDMAGGRLTVLWDGPGDALYPAWSPDGRWIVYCHQNITTTAVQGIENGANLLVISAAGGEPRRLTSGLCRDYVPCFSRDGESILFSSTRGSKQPSVGLYSVPFAGGDPREMILEDSQDVAFVEPAVSPDGRFIAHSFIAGFRSNWAVRLAKASDPTQAFSLTEPSRSCLSPVWSPDGRWIACTGYRPGDEGWGVYVISLPDGGMARLQTGPGNSRSPAWSPDGGSLVFENNRSGSYQLYSMPFVAPTIVAEGAADEAGEAVGPVLHYSFTRAPGETVEDLSGTGNAGAVTGELDSSGGAVGFEAGGSIDVAAPKGLDFGTGPFTVSAEIAVARHTETLRIIAVAQYPESPLGWQLYLNEEGQLWFNSRTPENLYVGARSDFRLPEGKRLSVLGYRDRSGKVSLVIDGALQQTTGTGAMLSYPDAELLRLGRQYNGGYVAEGVLLHEFQVRPGVPGRQERISRHLQEFLNP